MESHSSGEHHTYSQSTDSHGEKWLVAHLWETARGLPVVTVAVLDLPYILDCSWVANWHNPDDPDVKAEAERTEAADLSFPVILHPGGHLMDGYHRVCKALQLGQTTIQAVRFTEDTLPAPDWSWTKARA